MTDNELSQKCETLVKWAGWTRRENLPNIWQHQFDWINPQGEVKPRPDYFHDMNACERDIVPKLVADYGMTSIHYYRHRNGLDCVISKGGITTISKGTGSTMPDALANACLKLIGEK